MTKPVNPTRKIHFQGKVVDMATESIELPNGMQMHMDVVIHPGGAAVVALDPRQRVCLVKQFRAVFNQWLWELPAGKIDQQEAPAETAKRELLEEVGLTAKQWRSLGQVISSPGVFTERVFLYLAQGFARSEPKHEAHEVMEIHWVSLQEALQWCHNGTIVDAKTVVGLMRAQQILA